MVSRIGQRLQAHAQQGTGHPNWLMRRMAQLTVLGSVAARLALRGLGRPLRDEREKQEQFIERFAVLPSLRDYVQAPGVLRRWLGLAARALLMLQAADARLRELARSDQCRFVLRVDGRIDQRILRNMLIWHNHVIASYRGCGDGQSADIMLVLANSSGDESRLFDLISVAFTLERIRNVAVFWDDESIESATPTLISNAETERGRAALNGSDLRRLSVDVVDHVARHGTSGGIKVPQDARRCAQDFFKTALPGRIVIAVALKEDADGAIDAAELAWWLPQFDAVMDRHPAAAFVILNRLAPSHWHTWPAHIRFARHQGLTLQDAIGIAQFADGYLGVLDIFGLAANGAGRPGVYVPLDEGDLLRAEESAGIAKERQIMVASRDRTRIEAAFERFLESLSRL